MDRMSLREAFRQFVTGVAMITSHGSRGPNVMAAEWAFNVSYDPFLIAVHLTRGKASYEAIVGSGEFGVNMASEEQVDSMALAGHFSRYDVQKLASELFETYPAKRIRAPLIKGCLLNAECKLVQEAPMGDHVALVGEVLEFSVDPSKKPIVLYRGARRVGPRIGRRVRLSIAPASMRAEPGDDLIIEGELTSPKRARKTICVFLVDAHGRERSSGRTVTGTDGSYSLQLPVPANSPPGSYSLVGRYRGVEGKARVELR